LTRILITGGRGFLGRNLAAHLRERKDCAVTIVDREDSAEELCKALLKTDLIFHLAGTNRPQDPAEYQAGNAEFTEQICSFLKENDRNPAIVFSSSIQAEFDNPYGASKARAERALRAYGAETGARVRIYRLKNLFGKWCRPNYNSVTATFCHHLARGLAIEISDPDREIELSYVDEVVAVFAAEIAPGNALDDEQDIPARRIRLGDLAEKIRAFQEMKSSTVIPDFSDCFDRALYATYLSYVAREALVYTLENRTDSRGNLAELIKQKSLGQIFVSTTKPGITRGNHYHHTKTEKFLVVHGAGLIQMRSIEDDGIFEYRVTGEMFQVIDIPPGVTHSITNIGEDDLVTIFWASETFDPHRPDTYFMPVSADLQTHAAAEQRP
jgi:UDP-2-acetamido-2,6-beta-L-arabino-hexul-4-ose reductase